jgi:hypothetical protein
MVGGDDFDPGDEGAGEDGATPLGNTPALSESIEWLIPQRDDYLRLDLHEIHHQLGDA